MGLKSKTHTLVQGSISLLIGYNLFNILNFVFQFLLAYLLSREAYGAFAAVLPFIYITGACGEGMQTAAATHIAKKGNARFLISLSLGAGLLFAGLGILFRQSIANAIHVSTLAVIVASALMSTSLVLACFRGFLQGSERFKALIASLLGESFLKIVIFIILFFTALKLLGSSIAILSVVSASFILACIGYYYLSQSQMLRKKKEKSSIQAYLFPFIASLSIIGMYSIDLFIARMIFSADVATEYAYAALVGKTILWAIIPISKAMLPLTIKATKKKARALFKKSIVLTVCLGMLGVVIFDTMPHFILLFLTGKSLPLATTILGEVGLAMFLLACANLVILYAVARRRKGTKPLYWLASITVLFWVVEWCLLKTATMLSSFVHLLLIISGTFLVVLLLARKKEFI